MVKLYLRFCDGLVRAAQVAVIVLVAAMTANVLLAVFCRYVLGNGLSWSEETSRYLMIWMGFLGTGVALREGSHVAMTFFLDKAGPWLRRLMLQAIRGLSLIFLGGVIWGGAVLALSISSQVTPVLRISMAWPYLAIPVGCLLIACEMIALMLADPDGRAGAPLPGSGQSVRS
jgi:TRAP-type transport system small permease protein